MPSGVQLVDLLDHFVPALFGGQVCADVAVLQVHVDDLMALLPQDLHGLAADAAGAAGHYINSHKCCLL